MNNLSKRTYFLFAIILSLGFSSCNAKLFPRMSARNAEKKLFSKSLGKRIGLVVKAGIGLKSKIKQDIRDNKIRRGYDKSVKLSQKRTYVIQTHEVQRRMAQDKINMELRDKERMKKRKERFKRPQARMVLNSR